MPKPAAPPIEPAADQPNAFDPKAQSKPSSGPKKIRNQAYETTAGPPHAFGPKAQSKPSQIPTQKGRMRNQAH